MKNRFLLVGAGNMAIEYSKILKSLNIDYDVVCRSEESAVKFLGVTGKKPYTGGVENYPHDRLEMTGKAIVAVNVSGLYSTARYLLEQGVKEILVEKPGALYLGEVKSLEEIASREKAGMWIAYNRRFFESVRQASRFISEDGGVTSMLFEFTEWSHKIEPLKKEGSEKSRWFLSNSSHVADLAFFLGGMPVDVNSVTSGSLSWHPASSVFSGSGKTERGALFAYFADWEAPGRWSVEIMTRKNRLILKPLEELYVQEKGTVSLIKSDLDDEADHGFKPGLYRMTSQFIRGDYQGLCSIADQKRAFEYYLKMANYIPDEGRTT